MGWPEMARKSRIFWWFTVAAAAASPARLAAVRHEIPPEGSSGCCAPPRPACVAGRWCLVWSDLSRLANEQKAQLSTRFGELFPRVFGA